MIDDRYSHIDVDFHQTAGLLFERVGNLKKAIECYFQAKMYDKVLPLLTHCNQIEGDTVPDKNLVKTVLNSFHKEHNSPKVLEAVHFLNPPSSRINWLCSRGYILEAGELIKEKSVLQAATHLRQYGHYELASEYYRQSGHLLDAAMCMTLQSKESLKSASAATTVEKRNNLLQTASTTFYNAVKTFDLVQQVDITPEILEVVFEVVRSMLKLTTDMTLIIAVVDYMHSMKAVGREHICLQYLVKRYRDRLPPKMYFNHCDRLRKYLREAQQPSFLEEFDDHERVESFLGLQRHPNNELVVVTAVNPTFRKENPQLNGPDEDHKSTLELVKVKLVEPVVSSSFQLY